MFYKTNIDVTLTSIVGTNEHPFTHMLYITCADPESIVRGGSNLDFFRGEMGSKQMPL